MKRRASIFALAFVSSVCLAQNVKVTPLGSHTGELCERDRATLFEDPTGVRILYDPGQSVTGGDDKRLGDVHVVLVSHAHGDHLGDQKLKALDAGTCDKPGLVSAAPNSTTAEVVAAKNAAIDTVAPLAAFISRKVDALRGKPTAMCPQTGPDIAVPLAAPCNAAVQIGGRRSYRAANAPRAVEIFTVPAVHDSTVPRDLLSEAARKALEADNVSLQLGPPIGYVVRFTNGLTVYLSGDTGMHAEMRTVVHDYFKANLMELNLGASAVTPADAAYIADEVVQPNAVIASHVNEAATTDGELRAGSRTASFIAQVKGRPVYLALSGRTMEFDGTGACASGCRSP
jgi:L-ascorbate metabolism protein UlaG (beta-lactamase superfamily)